MNISFRLPGQNEKPIRVVTRVPVEFYDTIASVDITPDKITRTVKFSDPPIRREGNLFFVVQPPIALLTARMAWSHLLDLGHILEVHYPNRVTQKKPHENEVMISMMEDRIAINIDNLLWAFLRTDIPDPLIWEQLAPAGQGKEVIAECCRLVVMRHETSSGNRK